MEKTIEAQRKQLMQAHGVLTCLYEVLLHAEGEEAISYARAAYVAASLNASFVRHLRERCALPCCACLQRAREGFGRPPAPMNRRDLQVLSRERLRDARLLLMKGRYVGAYYLAGYAVECALKACIARQTQKHDFADKKAAIESHTHDLEKLIGVARLKPQLDATSAADKTFELNWSLVEDWAVEDRYNLSISVVDAKNLYRAISAKKSGVMTWIRRHW